MALPNPFVVPNARQSPYLQYLAGVGGNYGSLYGGAAPGLTDASGNLIQAGQSQIGPGEFDPSVAGLLATAENPVNNDVEDYFFNKYMADVNGRAAARGLIGQGPGEGMINNAGRDYAMNRADTASGRRIAAANAASGIRTGQVGRAASLTGAGLSPYDTLSKLLQGQAGVYTNAGELGNQVGISNARNQSYLAPSYLNAYGQLAGAGLGALGGAYNAFTAPPSDAQTAATRDAGLTSDMPNWSDSGGGGSTEVTGGFFDAKGGRVPGKGAYDHVRAVLTPQEFVIRRPVAEKARPALEALNRGHYDEAARKFARVASVAH